MKNYFPSNYSSGCNYILTTALYHLLMLLLSGSNYLQKSLIQELVSELYPPKMYSVRFTAQATLWTILFAGDAVAIIDRHRCCIIPSPEIVPILSRCLGSCKHVRRVVDLQDGRPESSGGRGEEIWVHVLASGSNICRSVRRLPLHPKIHQIHESSMFGLPN